MWISKSSIDLALESTSLANRSEVSGISISLSKALMSWRNARFWSRDFEVGTCARHENEIECLPHDELNKLAVHRCRRSRRKVVNGDDLMKINYGKRERYVHKLKRKKKRKIKNYGKLPMIWWIHSVHQRTQKFSSFFAIDNKLQMESRFVSRFIKYLEVKVQVTVRCNSCKFWTSTKGNLWGRQMHNDNLVVNKKTNPSYHSQWECSDYCWTHKYRQRCI